MVSRKSVLDIFREILTIPRESGHEELIVAYLEKFARERSLTFRTDKFKNVLINVPATRGMESAPTVILQSHTDMVCEKLEGAVHDFSKDPIKAIEEDGWLIAKETTLGADCGIGIAATLAFILDKDSVHGPLECLFTATEETGMDGAFGLGTDWLKGKILLNLDSEDDGELFIGCAGGVCTSAEFKYAPIRTRAGYSAYRLSFAGGYGGHSGDDIEKGRSNAIKSLCRLLYRIMREYDIDLCEINGGGKHNAIPRESSAVISVAPEDIKGIREICDTTFDELKNEYSVTDDKISFSLSECRCESSAIDKQVALNVISSLYGVAHGVLVMSPDIPGFVQTSTNLAIVKTTEGKVNILTSQRSSVESELICAAETVEASFVTAGAEVSHSDKYPGWKPCLDSQILRITEAAYVKLFKEKPIVRAIHAGLECGLLLEKYPGMDMISFGPTLRGVHTPGERLELSTLDKFILLLDEVLKNIKS